MEWLGTYPTQLTLLLVSLTAALLSKAAYPQGISGPNATPIDPLAMPRPSLEAFYTRNEILLDGRLDEIAWRRADSTDGVFWQVIPQQGVPSSERSVVKIIYDERFPAP